MDKEKCVRCGQITPFVITIPVDLRKWYIEGTGQLCQNCWNKLWPNKYLFHGQIRETAGKSTYKCGEPMKLVTQCYHNYEQLL